MPVSHHLHPWSTALTRHSSFLPPYPVPRAMNLPFPQSQALNRNLQTQSHPQNCPTSSRTTSLALIPAFVMALLAVVATRIRTARDIAAHGVEPAPEALSTSLAQFTLDSKQDLTLAKGGQGNHLRHGTCCSNCRNQRSRRGRGC